MAGVQVQVSGASTGQFTTDIEGTVRLPSMRDGSYHLLFERNGFTAVQRELTLRGGRPDVIDVVLSIVPAPEPPVLPEPTSQPLPPAPSVSPESAPPAVTSSGAVTRGETAAREKTVSITSFLEKNFIGGRQPLKESVLGCTTTARTRLLQLRDALAEHAHGTLDETLYVIAGEGALVVPKHDDVPLGPGSLAIIPSGVPHAIERRGKNPLILLSTLSGEPCHEETTPQKQE